MRRPSVRDARLGRDLRRPTSPREHRHVHSQRRGLKAIQRRLNKCIRKTLRQRSQTVTSPESSRFSMNPLLRLCPRCPVKSPLTCSLRRPINEATTAVALAGPPSDRLKQDQESLIGHLLASVRATPLTVLTQDFGSGNPRTGGLRIELARERLAVSLLLFRIGSTNSLVSRPLPRGSFPSYHSFSGSCITRRWLDGPGLGPRSSK